MSISIEFANALSFIIIPSFTPCAATQLVNRTGEVWLEIERLALIALVDEVMQRLAGVP